MVQHLLSNAEVNSGCFLLMIANHDDNKIDYCANQELV